MKFKPNYLNQVLVFFSCICFPMIPIVVTVIDIMEKCSYKKILDDFFMCMVFSIAALIVLAAFYTIINLIITAFVKTTVILDENDLEYIHKKTKNKCKYTEVTRLHYDIGSISKTSRNNPSVLKIFGENGLLFEIRSPSFIMIMQLKKKCENARFTTNYFIWYGVCVALSVVGSVCIFVF